MTSTLTASPKSSPKPSPHRAQASRPSDLTIRLDPSERWFIVGKTGSGKTYLVKHLLEQWVRKGWRVVIVDPKAWWMGANPKWARKGAGTVDAPWLVSRFNPKLQVQCFQPSLPAWEDAAYQDLCHTLIREQNIIVYHDDLAGVATSQRAAPGFEELWNLGRARNVAAWSAFQRPRKIPEVIKSQAETWIVLRIPSPQDRADIVDYLGDTRIATQKLPRYWWWYYHEGMDEAQLMRPLDVERAA